MVTGIYFSLFSYSLSSYTVCISSIKQLHYALQHCHKEGSDQCFHVTVRLVPLVRLCLTSHMGQVSKQYLLLLHSRIFQFIHKSYNIHTISFCLTFDYLPPTYSKAEVKMDKPILKCMLSDFVSRHHPSSLHPCYLKCVLCAVP